MKFLFNIDFDIKGTSDGPNRIVLNYSQENDWRL